MFRVEIIPRRLKLYKRVTVHLGVPYFKAKVLLDAIEVCIERIQKAITTCQLQEIRLIICTR